MRVLIDYRAALRERTGVGEYVHELVRSLVESAPPSERITIFSSSWRDRLDPDVLDGVAIIDRSVPVRVLNAAWHRLRWPPAELLTGERFDVVQTAHPLPIPARHAAQVVTVHDLDFLDHPHRTRAEIRRDYAALAPAAVRAADHVLVNSPHTAREVATRLQVSEDRLTIAAPGAPAWPQRRAEPAAGYLLFLGTLEPRKNLSLLLDAYAALLAELPNAPRLVLAGTVPPEAHSLLTRASSAPLAGHVELRGYIRPEDRPGLYEGALALVMPSHTEGFGMPALEAMTVGVPVLAANRGALPDLVRDAGELFEPDPNALRELLRGLILDVNRRARLRHAGWKRAEQYSWAASARRVRQAWSHAVDRRGKRRG